MFNQILLSAISIRFQCINDVKFLRILSIACRTCIAPPMHICNAKYVVMVLKYKSVEYYTSG